MKKLLQSFAAIVLTLTSSLSTKVFAEESTQDNTGVRILFTHDLHDHIDPYKITNTETNQTEVIGGYAALAGTINSYRTENTVLVDAGDFSMGTLYNSLFEDYAPDLSLLAMMGYDATTFGNHEFDYGIDSLTKMLQSASQAPTILSGNLVFGDDEQSQAFQQAWSDKGGTDTKIIERGGYKIGIFAVMGKDSIDYIATPGNNHFSDQIESAKASVKKLKSEGAQIILCLSHSGTNENPKQSEDEILAQKVDGIDVIISGHTHTVLQEPIYHNHTWIVSAGSFGKYLGMLDINPETKEKIDYQLIPITADSPVDSNIQAQIQEYKGYVNQYLAQSEYSMDQVIAHSNFAIQDINVDYTSFNDNAIGDLVADAYVYASRLSTKDTSFTIGLTAKGIIRSGLPQGDITLSDIYDVSSLGKDSDGLLGYPLIRVYLKGSDLMKVAELDRSIGKSMMVDGQLYFSDMQYQYSDYRFFLNHVISTEIRTNAGFYIPLDEDKLYPVITNLYIANMLPTIGKRTMNQLEIHTYDASGHLIDNFNDMILYNADGTELKEWQAVTRYISDMDRVNGIPEISSEYQVARHQKIADTKFSFIRFFKNTSAFGYRVYVFGFIAIVVLFAIIRLIIFFIAKRYMKKTGNQADESE